MNKLSGQILLVDDSPVIQTLIKKIFYGLGIDVIGLKAGAKVMETVENNDLDVIIMDIILPDGDGLDLIKQIRKLKDPDKSRVNIVGISGNYKSYTDEDFKSLDVEHNLVKPLDYDQLVEIVKNYLKK